MIARVPGVSNNARAAGRQRVNRIARLRSHVSRGRTDVVCEACERGWASSPITQNGCVRIMSNPSYPNALPIQAVMKRLADACEEDVHEFWSDEVSLLNPNVVDSTRIHGPRQLTDIYLLALAVEQA